MKEIPLETLTHQINETISMINLFSKNLRIKIESMPQDDPILERAWKTYHSCHSTEDELQWFKTSGGGLKELYNKTI